MAHAQYFRAGAGSVIYTPTGEIILFERRDIPDVWQLQQGGMDPDETPDATLWRELREETGLTSAEVTLTHTYPDWLYYTYPATMRLGLRDPNTLGQIHQWFFLALHEDATIDLTKASDQEFTRHKRGTFADLTTVRAEDRHQLKRSVYVKLAAYFAAEVLLDLHDS